MDFDGTVTRRIWTAFEAEEKASLTDCAACWCWLAELWEENVDTSVRACIVPSLAVEDCSTFCISVFFCSSTST